MTSQSSQNTRFPRAILHIDGDSFFASCEVARNPSLKGKPVVTGRERGIATSMSYEAKRLGITRAMTIAEIKRRFPQAVIVESDYDVYSRYSRRMYGIMRRFTDEVEEYSVDECFGDITGIRQPGGMTYQEVAARLKHDLESELGMTFSVGLSVNKTLAKTASKWRKPSGLTVIPADEIGTYLAQAPIDRIWGLGPRTCAVLTRLGVRTAADLAGKGLAWVEDHFPKPVQETYRELRGEAVLVLNAASRHDDQQSVQRTRSFRPTRDRVFIYAELSKNVEHACARLRRHGLYAGRATIFLKTQGFTYQHVEFRLERPVSTPHDIMEAVRSRFSEIYRPGVLYRATGVGLWELSHSPGSLDLFGHTAVSEGQSKVYEAIDRLDARYGRSTVVLGSSFRAMMNGEQAEDPRPSAIQRLSLPFLGEVS